jgi:hypothetical protein
MVMALRLAAPKRTGRLANHIWPVRHTSLAGGATVDLAFVTDVPYARYVLEGTRPHTIVPRNKKALSWMNQMGDQVFATIVNHPGTRPNPFPRRVWVGMREFVVAELAAQVSLKLR